MKNQVSIPPYSIYPFNTVRTYTSLQINITFPLNTFATTWFEVKFEIYKLIQPLIRTDFKNTEAGITVPVGSEKVKKFQWNKIIRKYKQCYRVINDFAAG